MSSPIRIFPSLFEVIIFPSPSLMRLGWELSCSAKKLFYCLNMWCEAPEPITMVSAFAVVSL